MLGNASISPSLKKAYPDFNNSFKDSYIFEFLNLFESHSEADLKKNLVWQMRNFILELGVICNKALLFIRYYCALILP